MIDAPLPPDVVERHETDDLLRVRRDPRRPVAYQIGAQRQLRCPGCDPCLRVSPLRLAPRDHRQRPRIGGSAGRISSSRDLPCLARRADEIRDRKTPLRPRTWPASQRSRRPRTPTRARAAPRGCTCAATRCRPTRWRAQHRHEVREDKRDNRRGRMKGVRIQWRGQQERRDNTLAERNVASRREPDAGGARRASSERTSADGSDAATRTSCGTRPPTGTASAETVW